jgi:predicted Zn-dependent protease
MKRVWLTVMLAAVWCLAVPTGAQIPQIKTLGKKAASAEKKAAKEATFTEEEERLLGADISAKLRARYGVVQDPAIHKYVSLLGTLLAQSSDRPKLKWTFIVLDTDGINAFAAPGGFIHITRGALALIRNESELACVLGHEISHVVYKHTLIAIRNAKYESAAGKAVTAVTHSDIVEKALAKGYAITLENAFSATEEEESDAAGVSLANGLNYSPNGLSAFLQRLDDRNKGLNDRSGLFASHPQTKERLQEIASLIEDEGLKGSAMVQARYIRSVTYRSVGVSQLSHVPQATDTTAKAEPQKSGLDKFLGGLSNLGKPNSSSATGSRAAVNPDRDAKGGPNKAVVVVTVTPAEIAAFRKGIVG